MNPSLPRTVYFLGLAGPALMVSALVLIERAGLHLSVGGGLIALISFGVCIAAAGVLRTSVKKRLFLILVALVIIPLEILVLGAIFIAKSGLTGTQ